VKIYFQKTLTPQTMHRVLTQARFHDPSRDLGRERAYAARQRAIWQDRKLAGLAFSMAVSGACAPMPAVWCAVLARNERSASEFVEILVEQFDGGKALATRGASPLDDQARNQVA